MLPTVRILYSIATHFGPVVVPGYAVNLPAPLDWLHLCIRRPAGHGSRWATDHFESGRCVPLVALGRGTVEEATRALMRAINSGGVDWIAAGLRSIGYRWCVPEGV